MNLDIERIFDFFSLKYGVLYRLGLDRIQVGLFLMTLFELAPK